jgi:GPH family glycoside/pentoside/hexuronide:cation symporter
MKKEKTAKASVPLSARIGWGFGGLADNYIMNVLSVMFLFIYTDHFKMPAILAGWALAMPRFFDVITDPLVGHISDNTRSRWGRRRPYIIVGAILSALLLPLFWTPLGMSTVTQTDWWKNGAFLYVIVLGALYTLTYTLYVIPYTALGYELTDEYDERTRVLAWRMYIGLFGSLTVPSVLALAQIDAFGDAGRGAFFISLAVAVVIIVSGIIPAIVCREKVEVQKQAPISFFTALKTTTTNKAFAILLVAYIVIIIGLFSAGNLGAFLNIYYICGGNKDFGTLMVGIAGALGAVVSYLSMFLITAVSVHTGKKTGMILGLSLALLGVAVSWFAMDPRWPLAQLISTVIACMGLQGCWLMVSSMVADICDEDELKTGLRREGMFGAVNGIALKAALAITALVGAWLLNASGFRAEAVDKFEEKTIAEVILPVREWKISEERFSGVIAEFEKSAVRFEEIAADKSAISGSKRTALWRLLKGENVYFRWYDFDAAVAAFLPQVETAALQPDNPLKPEMLTYVQRVKAGFVREYTAQQKVSLMMKKLIVGFQVPGLILAIVIFCFYPISRKKAQETRRILDERKASVAKETLP